MQREEEGEFKISRTAEATSQTFASKTKEVDAKKFKEKPLE